MARLAGGIRRKRFGRLVGGAEAKKTSCIPADSVGFMCGDLTMADRVCDGLWEVFRAWLSTVVRKPLTTEYE